MDDLTALWRWCDDCRTNPASMAPHVGLVFASYDLEDREGAVIATTDTLVGLGQPPPVRFLMGATLLEVASYERALAWFDVDDPDCRLGRAETLALLGDTEGSAAAYTALRAAHPGWRSRWLDHKLGRDG